jgi:hypothetical protein
MFAEMHQSHFSRFCFAVFCEHVELLCLFLDGGVEVELLLVAELDLFLCMRMKVSGY